MNTFLARWSAAHGGIEPSGLVLGWLRVVYVVARPLARRGVPPWVLTALSCACGVAVPCFVLGGLPLVGAVFAVLCALLDGLDGAVAVLTDTATAWGRVLDPLVDRIGDVAFLVALVLAGAPGWLAVGVGTLTLLQESVRSSARLPDVGVVSVWERPSRVIVTALGLLGTVVSPGLPVATIAVLIAAVLAVVGFVQVLVTVRRRLRM
ncbi:CDP-diacylglycerol--glycerol-3-phosphate 3-phosphatidyltransferase [Actinomycetospora succinea]|uniref:CDP-diacylglycerol--glycerol-3-phosphate 3-phosphatidyltransferase n=1 Tax=Actinomycetospora succinea TaxID=663603 RepID=A0A4R6UHS9_9PSEU|nr:CDP-alcohol phosphatidyltransferase family protein [Actinomycetospora succinea]TDQ46408.1 CDP-diacylglycerol--glycerol-3-phosphate 3-phosphatidyltransferase [Actinomycetospora succinea]